ncbi:FAD-binding oxidoreductase [Nocardioides sp. NPDC092400]|uniref:NAD(P)/FAD-dependent oxidoreductase n=1 Tax=Nocardioides sp. NPDC092400 TaxID=3155196 RepID=UPI003441E333
MDRVDVLVVGGGFLGCATAWMLAREGADVLLVERDQVNQHASGQNAGSLHFQLEYRMIERGIEAAKLAAEAMPLHLEAAQWWERLTEEVGEPLGVSQTGGLMLAHTAEQERLLHAKAEVERAWGLDVRVLDREAVLAEAPYLSPTVRAASHCPIEGKADTRLAAPALARAAARLGADVQGRCEVVRLARAGGGWTATLRSRGAGPAGPVGTERTVQADAVVLAAGVWTTELGAMIGSELPTIPLALTMSVTVRRPPLISHLVQHAGTRLSLKQAGDGNVLIGGGWPARLGRGPLGEADLARSPEIVAGSVAGNARAAVAAVPELAHVPVLRTWVGTTTVTPDQLPLVGAVPDAPGAFVATGGSAFTLGPSFAQVLTDLVQGRPAGTDLTPYDPRRYRGGARVG